MSLSRTMIRCVSNGTLQRFDVIFDYAHERLHLRPNSHFSDPFD